MIKFFLDPPSGHADSYLDIRFVIEFEKADQVEAQLVNKTSNQPLDILSVEQGRILKESLAVATNVSSVEGYVNLFNKDKMNYGLRDFVSVDIGCQLKIRRGDSVITEEAGVTFYNESKSLDNEIIPFDIEIHNPEIDMENNVPLRMTVTCDTEKRYELCVMSEDRKSRCPFEVITRNGSVEALVPAEVLYADLNISTGYMKRYYLYWTKFEGVDYERFMNRKSIQIPGSRLTFLSKHLSPRPQGRLGPTGAELSEHFILSDRYFVHTWKDYSAFAKKTSISPIRLRKLSFFMQEAQGMQLVAQSLRTFGAEEDYSREIRHAVRHDLLTKKRRQTAELGKRKESKFFEAHSKTYARKTFEQMSLRDKGGSIRSFGQVKRTGGCGCSRKK